MTDTNTAQLGQDLLDSVWAIEEFRDKTRSMLEVEDGDDLMDQLGAGMLVGDRAKLDEVVLKIGGISGLLGIVTEVVRLEELRNDALDRYVKARKADQLAEAETIAADAEDARTNVESYIERKHGETVVPGFSDVPLDDLR